VRIAEQGGAGGIWLIQGEESYICFERKERREGNDHEGRDTRYREGSGVVAVCCLLIMRDTGRVV